MARFFETFNVIEEEGNWTSGYVFDTLGGGFQIRTTDICEPATRTPPPDFPMGQEGAPFVIESNMVVPARCAPDNVKQFIAEETNRATEHQVTKALWRGSEGTDTDLFLTHASVTEVARSLDPSATLGLVLETAFEQAPGLNPVIHLGWQTAMSLQLGLANLGIPFVIGNGYPKDVIAVTGPVTVRLTPASLETDVDMQNRQYFQAVRLGAIEFDPHYAVRAASTP